MGCVPLEDSLCLWLPDTYHHHPYFYLYNACGCMRNLGSHHTQMVFFLPFCLHTGDRNRTPGSMQADTPCLPPSFPTCPLPQCPLSWGMACPWSRENTAHCGWREAQAGRKRRHLQTPLFVAKANTKSMAEKNISLG